MHRIVRVAVPALAIALQAACGGSTTPAVPPGYTITLGPMSFNPPDLSAPAGATITVVNGCTTVEHSVTQEATVDAFTPGAPAAMTPFDTGLFLGGTRTFVLPSGLSDGTVLYSYCRNHIGAMVPSTGRITITASSPPGGGGGGYGY